MQRSEGIQHRLRRDFGCRFAYCQVLLGRNYKAHDVKNLLEKKKKRTPPGGVMAATSSIERNQHNPGLRDRLPPATWEKDGD